MTPRITVYTVILNAWDNLRPPAVVDDTCRYVCFTDQPRHCPPWEMQPAWLRYKDPHRNSRIPKILSHLHTETEFSIYHDGCLQLARRPATLIAEMLEDADWAMYRHPCRQNVYEEMVACKKLGIGYGSEMQAQVDRYRAAGLNGTSGLWSGGVIIRRRTDETSAVNEAWWREYIDGCSRDQIAFPMARQIHDLKIHTIKHDILTHSGYFNFVWHGWATHKGDNPSFESARQRESDRQRRLEELCPL